MSIQEIVQGCKKQKRTAQKHLYNRYVKQMYRLCFRFVGNAEDAEDCVCEGFFTIFEKLEAFTYQEVNSFETWMKRIFINRSLMLLRQRNKFQMVQVHDQDFSIQPDFVRDMDIQYILNMIVLLPEGYRTVFNLYAIEGYSHAEISKLLTISESTSKSQLHKARKLLQKWLKNENIVIR